MKKYLLGIIIVIFSIFLVTGCKTNNKKGKGKVYELISLKDGQVEVFEGIIPKGWKYNLESNWNNVSSVTPGIETVTITSPDLTASIKIISQESYTENKKYNEGENRDYYTTYLHYMNASDYLDYYMNKNYNGSKYVKDVDMDSKILDQVKEYNNIIYQAGLKDAAALNTQKTIKVAVSIIISYDY